MTTRIPLLCLLFVCATAAGCEDNVSTGGGLGSTNPGVNSDSGASDSALPGGDGASGGDAIPGADADTAGVDADAGRPSNDAGRSDAQATDARTADAAAPDAGRPASTSCQRTCSTANDCAMPGMPLQGVANWQCAQNRCRYLGCRSTDECTSVFHMPYVCVQAPGTLIPSCLKACTMPANCAVPQAPLFGEANYRCTMGGCEWRGCMNADQCRATFMNQTYVCEPVEGLTFNNCVKPCMQPGDCATPTVPAYDATHWSCVNARCRYLGCSSTSVCEASYPGQHYVCE